MDLTINTRLRQFTVRGPIHLRAPPPLLGHREEKVVEVVEVAKDEDEGDEEVEEVIYGPTTTLSQALFSQRSLQRDS